MVLALAPVFVGCATTSPASSGPESGRPRAGGLQGNDLGQKADDPTESLMALQVNDWYTSDIHGLPDEDTNQLVLRAVLPFQAGGLNQIFRATTPFITHAPGVDSGLADVTLFDLIVFDESWGRWGVGPVMLLPTGGRDRGAEQWAAGPALGFTTKRGPFLLGLFNQNLFSFAGDDERSDMRMSTFQPIVNRSLGGGWTTGFSQMQFAYDWEADRWSSLPLGAKAARIVHVGGVPVLVALQYEHNFADDMVGPESTLRLTLKFLFPK